MLKLIMVSTMDTKGVECDYLIKRIRALAEPDQVEFSIIDAGIRRNAVQIKPTIMPSEVAQAAGTSLDKVRTLVRGEAIATMSIGAAKIVKRLYDEGKCHGIISLCGGSGGSIASQAMETLPVGIPKVLATPLASGAREFGFYIGTKDVTIMHTVIDIAGINSISKIIYDNLAGTLVGQAKAYALRLSEVPDKILPAIGITMIGNTTDSVDIIRQILEEHGYEVICFHSSGVGGKAMEELIKAGRFSGIIDYTTNEIFEEIIGGLQRGTSEERMTVAGRYGLPQIIVPGCVDLFDEGPFETLSDELKASRKLYKHSPNYTLCQLTNEEMRIMGKIFAEKISLSKGPVKIVIPMKGFSIPGCPGGMFDNPVGIQEFTKELRDGLTQDIPIIELDLHINDFLFAQTVAKLFMQMMEAFYE